MTPTRKDNEMSTATEEKTTKYVIHQEPVNITIHQWAKNAWDIWGDAIIDDRRISTYIYGVIEASSPDPRYPDLPPTYGYRRLDDQKPIHTGFPTLESAIEALAAYLRSLPSLTNALGRAVTFP